MVVVLLLVYFSIFFFNDTATPEIYTYCPTLSLHDALPISFTAFCAILLGAIQLERAKGAPVHPRATDWTVYLLLVIIAGRSEEHTSELQSLMRISYAVFCLKKKNKRKMTQQRRANTSL